MAKSTLGETPGAYISSWVNAYPAGSLRRDVALTVLLGGLGTAASYFSVNIPHTELYIEGRWIFGFLAAVLLHRLWLVMAVTALLCAAGFHQVPLLTAFVGNMLCALPSVLVLRWIHGAGLHRIANPALYTIAWMMVVLFAYEVFTMPIIAAFRGAILEKLSWDFVWHEWLAQHFIEEALFVGLVSGLGMAALRSSAALRRSEQWLTTVLDSIGDAVITTGPDGVVTMMNPMAQKLTGWSLAEARGRPLIGVFEIVNAHTGEPAEHPVARVLQEGVTVGLANDTCLLARDGARRQIADSAAPIRDRAGAVLGVVMVFRDVTEQYGAQHALRESEAKFRSLAEASQDYIMRYDEHGRHLYMSPAACKVSRLTEAEVLGKTHRELGFDEGLSELWEERIRNVFETGQPDGAQFEWESADGRVVLDWRLTPEFDEEGKVRSVLGVSRDITQLKRSEEALRENEQRYRTLAENFPGGAIFLLDSNLRFVFCGGRALAETGLRKEDIIGKTVSEVFPSSICEVAEPQVRAAFRGESSYYEVVYQDRIFTDYVSPVLREDGEIREAVVIALDITELRRAEEERLRLERQFQQAQKLESLGVLAGGIAHDFNNILMAILAHADLALDALPHPSSARESIQEIAVAGQRAAELCRQMLAYAGHRASAESPVDLRPLIHEMAQLLRTSMSKKATLTLETPPDLPSVVGDAGQLRQVLMNLILNASEALEEQEGAVTVRAGAVRGGPAPVNHQHLGNDLDGVDCVFVEVADTGCGMDPETQRRIFEPFFTTKFTGRGLGLAATLGIIQAHRGAVRIVSQPGAGTTFRILLPAAAASQKEPGTEPAGAQGSEWQGAGKALLVDDEESLRRVGSKMLGRLGFEVITAVDGQEAVSLFQEGHEDIDIVLMDLTMPRMSGAEALPALRETDSSVPVVLMSGFDEQHLAARFAGKGFAGYLQKPFSFRELRAILARLFSGNVRIPSRPQT